MWEGSYTSRTSQAYYDWGVIAGYFEGMRLLGELKDKMNPLPTVEGQLSLLGDLAEEKTSAFSFSQEIIDTVIKSSTYVKPGKYGIYVYFLKDRTNQQKADYLKDAYGFVGAYPVIAGTGIDMLASSEGMRITKGETEVLLKWGKVAKRIDELIAAGRYMTEKEMEYLPEYEKSVLVAEIYHFYRNQPEEVVRPYPAGSEYHAGVKAIRPQIDSPERVEEILSVMEEVLNNTADFDNRYKFMQKVYRDLADYRDGKFSLISPIPAETETPPLPEPEPPQPSEGKKEEPDSLAKRLNELYKETDLRAYEANIEQGESEQETIAQIEKQLSSPDEVMAILDYLISVQQTTEPDVEAYQELAGLIEEVQALPAMNPPYDLQPETVVYIGMEKYEILTMTDRMVVLHDLTYPLFTKDMPREEFDRKLRENPANDHLKIRRPLPEPPAEKKNMEPLPAGGGQGTDSPNAEKEEKQLSESDIPIGTEIVIDDRRFSVDSVDMEHGTVSLKDLTFQSGTGFPVFRSDPIQLVFDLIQGQKDSAQKESGVQVDTLEKEGSEQADLAPAWEKKKPAGRIRGFDLHPEIPQEQRSQFRITNDELGYGTPKEKFRANIAAIQILKKCEDEDRYATPEEQEILAKYVGWGGLADAFDETKSAWGYEYLELKTVLTPEEYAAARQSTLTAFYTPPVVIRAMYQALENMGLKSGNILEPSCAVGNFMGMKPESLSDCKIYGVEVDSISGRIAGQLYQKSTVAVQGYEEAELPDSFFDVAIGNVPFGQFKLSDRRYDKNNFLVHDYFFAKTLDKVRPGGVIAFITSSGTMDKKNPAIRRYIAQRAELLGAIRLPNDTFKKNAGTEVTSDILFLQKRDRMVEAEPDWLYLDVDENGITQNRYFVEHPEMVLGEMVMESTQYGMDSTCRPYENMSLESLLAEAVENIQAEIAEHEADELVEEEDNSIPADPSVANFSFTVYDGKIYYQENSRMKPVELSVTAANRVKGMVAIRDCVRELIAYQTEGYADTVIEGQQGKLNQLYDTFQKKYGILNARANSMVFSDDNSYPLLCSLEVVAEDGVHARKADMFHKRTIKPHQAVTKVDTASEALSLSLSEKARVDMDYMCSLTGKSAEEIERELSGVIFRLPDVAGGEPEFVSEDEYLSGNVREKLKEAKLAAAASEAYQINVEALEKVQPKDLTASEISVRLGATWIPISDVSEFMFQLLDTPNYSRWNIKIHFSKFTGEWNIEGKSNDKGNPKANNAYGTHRVNAYKIIEDTLNLRDTRVYDYIPTEDGKKKAVLNKEETAIAQGKQDLIKQAFQDWIWQNPERRQRLTAYYNENFNAIRPREYDGSHLNFYGMNPEIQLRQHQKNGAARIIYGGNSLLAYVVGAGKTYTMVAAAMECKRLGLCNKSMIVVPNHIIEQFAAEWLQLYPAANLLVATKKDFETKNRKKFCARIATSDIDAVIIGHSQFEKIPLSLERQQRMLEEQIEEIIDGIAEAKRNGGSRFTIKQMEKSKKSLQAKLSKLNDQSRKDDVVFFEELGIDRLFVDEADGYKNLYLYTKMRNVGGIAQTEAQKSSDMFMKCRYLDGMTGGKGVIFATGTPVSNSMVELYTMQRYLQYNTLVRNHLQHFDAWASTFGETVSAIELAPEGSGYRMKTRFAKFYNLPELMMMFREVADIQTADMLNLPVPEAEYKVVAVKPSEIQKDMVQTLGERAERVRNGMVNPMQDNMLLITNDGRKLALDQRLTNEMLPDEPESKVNACVNEVYRFWEEGKEQKLTQLLFCDLSTPKNDGTFSVYNDVRDKLIAKGIPPQEIEFIHDANTEVKKKELFSKVRRGAVRILMGSTFKMGAGTNVQNLIIASHDLDCPWRPRDLEQRGGRTIRQGNQNKKVFIVRYVTEGTFDAYMYQMIENKQKFISQIMTSKSPARTIEDIDEVALSYAEIKALATGNPYIKEKMDLDIQVSKLQLLKQSFLSQRYEMEDKVTKHYPMEIKRHSQWIVEYQQDIEQVKAHTPPDRDTFPPMQINGVTYGEKKEAGQAIIAACKAMTSPDPVPLGAYRGLAMELSYSTFSKEFVITLQGKRAYHVTLGTDIHGNITRLDNEIEKFGDNLSRCEERLETLKAQLENAKVEAVKEFPKEQELAEKTARLGELNALLDMDKKENIVLDCEPEEEESEPEKGNKDRER
ncbi:helicase [bacterium D16-51]|nr:helicase [bacterium D16-59]RKI57425.1 helicase [bacterium D16-51]